ncbi:MAG TPA: hypothetical protein VIB48_11140 [Acidimicrobiia bacterium]|jgi:hypothetical protein
MLGFDRRTALRRDTANAIPPAETSDAIIGAIDAALAFTAGRELFARVHVASVVDMLEAVEVGERCAPVVASGLAELRAWAESHATVSAYEVADRLLDLRLDVAATLAPTLADVSLVPA